MSDDTKTVSENLNMDSFNPKKAELITLADEAKKALSVEIIDTKSYEVVHKAQMKLKDARVNIEKTGKAMREDAVAFQKKVIEVEKDLISVIITVEEELKAKKTIYDKAQEEKKEAERKAQEELANTRNQELAKYGYVHDLFDLKIMEEDKFQELITEKKTSWETAENERIEKEKIENRKNNRISTLLSIGMFFNGIVYTSSEVPTIGISPEAVENGEDDIFDQTVESFRGMIDIARENIKKAQEDQAKKQKELDDREADLKKKEDEQKKIDDEKKRTEELEKAKRQAEKDTEARIKKENDDHIAREKKIADDKAEEDRQEQIKTARLKKYRDFCESIGYKKEEDYLWITKDVPEGREFYKKVGIYLK